MSRFSAITREIWIVVVDFEFLWVPLADLDSQNLDFSFGAVDGHCQRFDGNFARKLNDSRTRCSEPIEGIRKTRNLRRICMMKFEFV